MALPDVVAQEAWLDARRALLAKEKDLTRARDALSAERRRLPMVPVRKEYRFVGPDGEVGLLDLFGGRRQLVVQHFMFDPAWDEGCSSCTAAADEVSDGLLAHLAARETSFAMVSRAPLAKLERWKAQRGWSMPWVSSGGSDFNADFQATVGEGGSPTYNFAPYDGEPYELPGYSFFLRDGDELFHTNSIYARGTEALGGSYGWLDMTALGRQEAWEEPKGRAGAGRAARPDFAP